MARHDAARYAAMSDPDRNRWFRCRWILPPPLERKSPGAPTPGQIFENNLSAESLSGASGKLGALPVTEDSLLRATLPCDHCLSKCRTHLADAPLSAASTKKQAHAAAEALFVAP